MGIEIAGQIEKVNGKELSYNDFAERYLAKSHPVVISYLTEDWRAREDWVTENGLPSLNFFATHFGKSRVQVKSTPLAYIFKTVLERKLLVSLVVVLVRLQIVIGENTQIRRD